MVWWWAETKGLRAGKKACWVDQQVPSTTRRSNAFCSIASQGKWMRGQRRPDWVKSCMNVCFSLSSDSKTNWPMVHGQSLSHWFRLARDESFPQEAPECVSRNYCLVCANTSSCSFLPHTVYCLRWPPTEMSYILPRLDNPSPCAVPSKHAWLPGCDGSG